MDLFDKIRVVDGNDLLGIAETQSDMMVSVDRGTIIASGTCPMPAFPVAKQVFILSTRIQITALTMNPQGKTLYNNPTTLPAETAVAWYYEEAANAWFPFSNLPTWGKIVGTLANQTDLNNALAAKQATLVSGTNIKTVNSLSLLGSGNLIVAPYTLSVQALTSSPGDGATVYFGNMPKAPTSVAAASKIYIRQAGTIKRAEIYCFSGTAGSNEAWPLSIRLNNTTDTLIASLSVSASERVYSNTNLNIAVVSGDYFEIKMVNPTWGTNPLTTIFGGYVYIE